MTQVVQPDPVLKPRLSKWFWVCCVGLLLATLGASLTSVPWLPLLPVVLLVFGIALFKLPLRAPTLAVLFLGLVLDNPSDIGPWKSPLFELGALMLTQLKKVIPIDALVVTGIDASLAGLLALYFFRSVRGEAIDSHPVISPPAPLVRACLAAIGIVLFTWGYGLGTGGEMKWSLWQLMQMLHVPYVALAFAYLLPGPSVAGVVGKIYVAAGLVKACMAIGISRAFPDAPTMTSHQDSILFATATVWLGLHVLERPSMKSLVMNLGLQPILLLGMVLNDRRLVWVQVAFAAAIVFLITDWSWIKFRLARLAISAIPVALLYIAVGWTSSGTGIFRPVGTLRSMADSKSDDSTMWRDLENHNLRVTLAQNPILGTGLGHPFVEDIKLPDVTSQYPLEPYQPHNSVLGLWAYTGLIGFSSWWTLLVVMSYYAQRAYRTSRAPPMRIAAMMTPAALLIYMIQSYGDIGLGAWHGALIVGSAGAISAKLALVNDAAAASAARAQT